MYTPLLSSVIFPIFVYMCVCGWVRARECICEYAHTCMNRCMCSDTHGGHGQYQVSSPIPFHLVMFLKVYLYCFEIVYVCV